ncbi:MAG: hypothetical protein NVSMB62_27070 [Acidobacteriaceae bacterium]
MMLADLGGEVIAQSSVLLGARQKTPEGICSLVLEGLKGMCRQSGTPLRKVRHLTAGAPGITNVDTGVVVSAPNLDQWNEVPLRALLEKGVGIPCLVDNDTNLAAIGEYWRGAVLGVGDFVFIALGTGVGAGIFMDGRLHRGAGWSAGEIGYMGVGSKRRAPMKVRALGQLEQAIGGAGIEKEWRRILVRGGSSAPRTALGVTREHLKGFKALQIFDLAAEGDRNAGELLRYTSAILADAIADISLVLNPKVVVLGGGIGSHPELCRMTDKLVQRHEFAQPILRSSSLGTQAQLHGAVSLSLTAVEQSLLEE